MTTVNLQAYPEGVRAARLREVIVMSPYSDITPCVDAEQHLSKQRHARSECPAASKQPETVEIDTEVLETLKDAAAWEIDQAVRGQDTSATERAIKIATALIEGVQPRCDNPNPLQPGLKCSQPEEHEGMHSADSALGHHEWRPKA